MDCIKIICFYLKKYISSEQFETIFYEHIEDFQNSLDEDMYLNILSTRFSSKHEKISLETDLQNYIIKYHNLVYGEISDSYVEKMIDLNEKDLLLELLKNKFQKIENVNIDCSTISTQSELISTIKQALKYPHSCGDNWDAIEDLIFDIILPRKLFFYNWNMLEEKLPRDAAILKSILDKNNGGRCTIIYLCV